MRTAFLLPLLLIGALPARGQGVLAGRITSGGEPVPFANVGVRGTTLGAAADEEGLYRIGKLAPGEYVVVVSAVGFAPAERAVRIAGEEVRADFELRERVIEGEEVVVTGTLKETFVSESAVKVEVVSARFLEKSAARNLMEAVDYVNGLYQQVDCGVCGTNSIRINGMDGPYTAVLIDGAPVMSSLASVYGLNGLHPAIIQQLEVVKGPASTLYGTEAMGGVINIITRDPRFAPLLNVHLSGASTGEAGLDFSLAPRSPHVRSLLSGTLLHRDRFIDGNGDGFSDIPLTTQLSLFGKVGLEGAGRRRLDLSAKLLLEDRFGGVREWTKAHRGSDRVYGESIYTNRVEVVGSFRPPLPGEAVQLDFAFSRHDQDSYYGRTRYLAEQQVYFANLLWNRAIGARHDVLLGATFRYQTYDDDTPATATPERRLIPGVFAQHERVLSDRMRLLLGLRADHHAAHGLIFSPRLNARWQPLGRTALRLNAGTGFRVVNLFTEEHAAFTGARTVRIAEQLQPERSYNVTLNLNRVFDFGTNPLTVDADAFFTRFTNRIIPNYDADPDLILYANLSGYSVSRGVSLTLAQNFTLLPLAYTLGATWQRVYARDGGRRVDQILTPGFQGVFSLTATLERIGVRLDYTGKVTGPMRLPAYAPPFSRPTRSRPFTLQNLKATRPLRHDLDVYAAVQNLFDYTQPSPLVDPEHPFGEHFDTAYVYGPLRGRTFVLGASWHLD